MIEVDMVAVRDFIKESGIKQKVISRKSGIPEAQLSLVLQGKRKCEAGEYASICKVIGVNPNKFLKPRMPDKEGE